MKTMYPPLRQPKSILRPLSVAFCALTSLSTARVQAQNKDAPVNPPLSASQEAVAFEVATIKPGSADSNGIRLLSLNISPDGRVKTTNWTLKNLVCAAYDIGYWQVQGGPLWIEKDEFDIEAKPPDPQVGLPSYNIHHDNWRLDDARLRSMLQALLKDRFALKAHLVTKEGPIYVLERTSGELALIPSKQGARNGFGGVGFGMNYGRVMVNSSTTTLAAFLSANVLHQPVTDKTGLTGTYDFTTKNIPDAEEMQTPDMGIFLQYVKEMGLKLTKSTGPVTTLIIENSSQPSPN